MKYEKMIIVIIFILGMYYCLNYSNMSVIKEGFSGNCPDILIQNGNTIYLKKSNRAMIPGVNPIKFNNLEEYVEYVEWQKSQNINCPVLFLQKGYNTQGDTVFKIRPDIFNPQGGLNSNIPYQNGHNGNNNQETSLLLDSNRNDQPYNNNNYPAYDPDNQYIGIETPLDKINEDEESGPVSANPMFDNWGGKKYSREQVKAGAYAEDYVYDIYNKN